MRHWNFTLSFGAVHATLAVVALMAVFCKPFTSAKIQYFDHSELNEAEK